MKVDLKISSATFTSFYSWYSWPNVVLGAISGVLIDKWLGMARGATIFCGFIVVGQIVFGIGGFFRLIWLMNMGRFVFGMGSEAIWTVQSVYAASWFFGKQLNFVFEISFVLWLFLKKGSLANLNTIHPIYDSLSHDISGPKRIGITLFIAVSTCIFSLGCAFILWWLDNRRRRVLHEDNLNDKAWSNACNSLIYFMSAILSPILGYVIDRTGRDVYWLISSITGTIIAHALIAFLFLHPIVPLVLMGIAYSILAASLWPLVAHLVPKQMLGTAYGLMQSIQNLSLAIMNIFTGLILDRYGYFMLEIFFIICLEMALLTVAVLYVYNTVKKGILNDSAAVRYAKRELVKTPTDVEIRPDNRSL
ncbi:unnamed protein product [Rotaria sordida]|uniref:Lysosomal dipeptide transporter MFSD1 n=1 Tax=Rotaria sordida TaxID=392033 RepID=A0A814DZA2_9BILA|nr:unnamed protein product [Rotaria sordida]